MKLSDLAVETAYCTYCRQWPGYPCRTKSGARATFPHGARTRPIFTAFNVGFTDGQTDILKALDSAELGESWAQGYIDARRRHLIEEDTDGE